MSNLTGRQIILVAACALAAVATGIGIYGLVRGPGGAGSSAPEHSAVRIESQPRPAAEDFATPQDRALPHTNDAIAYAKAVATSLFDWDTSTGFLPTDYSAAVLADADPSGEETPGLLTDVAAYLPTVEQWLDLGAMGVVQSLEIKQAYVPDSWAGAVEHAHGELRPGTAAVTITGTRHRSGVWNGEDATSSHPVSFTVFVACPPGFDRCHLLRLSQLDNPLR